MAAIYLISLCDFPDYVVKLRAFTFASVMHLYWGHTQRRNYVAVDNILKIIDF